MDAVKFAALFIIFIMVFSAVATFIAYVLNETNDSLLVKIKENGLAVKYENKNITTLMAKIILILFLKTLFNSFLFLAP